jgi:hypothetical protein
VAEAGKAFHMPQRIHFIPTLLYPANNYTTGSRRVYEYEFIIRITLYVEILDWTEKKDSRERQESRNSTEVQSSGM